jgi:hypothetical protein
MLLNINRKLLTGAVILLALGTTPAHAGTTLHKLIKQPGNPSNACTTDGVWCTISSGEEVAILQVSRGKQVERARLPLPNDEDTRLESKPWNAIIRVKLAGQPEYVLAGVEQTRFESYSGGGGSLTMLQLSEVGSEKTEAPEMALEVPLASSFMVRACFTKEDEKHRRGACHDEYRFSATLTAVAKPSGSEVRLSYRTRADTFPGKRNRLADSTEQPPLRKRDLYRAVDPSCTVDRLIVRKQPSGNFVWNKPLPDCEDYLQLQ